MAAHGRETGCTSVQGRCGSRWFGWALMAALSLAGCSSGSPAPGAGTTTESPSATSVSPSGGQSSDGFPEEVFTDAELVAIINGVGQSRNLPFPAAQDSARQR